MGTRVDGWTRYIAMCPDGSEGATYAMLTTLSNMAGTVAFDISTLLTGSVPASPPEIRMSPKSRLVATLSLLTLGWLALADSLVRIWDVSNEAIEKHRYDGMWKLTLLTSLVQVAPLPMLFLIPKNKQDQIELQKSSASNFYCGAAFVVVLAISLIATAIEAIAGMI